MRRKPLLLVLLAGVVGCVFTVWWAQGSRVASTNELRSIRLEGLEAMAYRARGPAAPLCVLGERRLAEGNVEAALRAFTAARERDPNSAAALAGYVLARGGAVSPGWAEMVLRELTAVQPQSPAGFLALGQLYIQNGEVELAGEPLRRALELAPQDSEAAYQYGVWSGMMGATGRGIQDLETACRLVPRMSRYRVALADLLIHLGKYEPALEHLRIAEAETPDSGLVQYHLGRLRLMGKVSPGAAEEGVRRLKQALELSPGWDLPRLSLGRYYLQSGEVKAGVAEFEAVLRSGNQSAEVLAALAQGYFRAGRPRDGKVLNQRYNELLAARRKELAEREAANAPGPDHPARLLRRAQQLRTRGRVLAALAIYRELLTNTPNDTAASQAVRELTLQSEVPHASAQR